VGGIEGEDQGQKCGKNAEERGIARGRKLVGIREEERGGREGKRGER
jgi:hypothetical protein